MKNEFYFDGADGITKIHGIEWIPEGAPKAVLQLAHGMTEHIERYDIFAQYMCSKGIYVVGNDHLGHGKSVINPGRLGYFAEHDGMGCLIKDLHTIRKMTSEKYPDTPYFVLGHSMGSFLMRQYIMRYGKGLAGAVIIGTAKQPGAVLKFGKITCAICATFTSWRHHSRFMNNLSFGKYNSFFKPNQTDFDWLSNNRESIDKYVNDPLCGYVFTYNGFLNLFRSIEYIQKKKNIENIPDELPILLMSGEDDAVGDFGKGVKQVYDTLIRMGKKAKMKLYPKMRHELLNEPDCTDTYNDILDWMKI